MGLGNPWPVPQHGRHNLGVCVVEALAEGLDLEWTWHDPLLLQSPVLIGCVHSAQVNQYGGGVQAEGMGGMGGMGTWGQE